MKRYVLDSYAMIAYFEDEPGADRVAKVLRQLVQGKAKGFMSVVNWGEVYYNTMREQGVAEAEKVILEGEISHCLRRLFRCRPIR
jgi:ribonuclease VapC